MSEIHQCSVRIFTTARGDFRGRPCRLKATVQLQGRWYCTKHHPDAVKKRRAANQAKWQAEIADLRHQNSIKAAEAAVVQAAPDWNKHEYYTSIVALSLAVRELERLEGDK